MLHLSAYVNVSYFFGGDDKDKLKLKDKVKISYVEKKKPAQESTAKKPKQIVEQRMKKTEKPKDPRFLGAQDHATKKETKAKNPNTTAKKAGPKGNSQQQRKLKFSTKPRTPNTKKKIGKGKRKSIQEQQDTIRDLMPSVQELYGQMDAGYQDYIDEDLEESNVIDLNTSNFRFLGYVSQLRQAIQMTWIYPNEAVARRLEGKVGLKFRINKDGSTERVEVVQSSGYTVLDEAIVSAIKLASPFAPLPQEVTGEYKVFAGTFYYTLGNMFRAH